MKDRLASILKKNGIDDWKLRITRKEGTQGYLIDGRVEMMRRIDAADITVTVYRDIDGENGKSRGAMTVELFPSMYESEIAEKLQIAKKGAGTVRNRWYPLASGGEGSPDNLRRNCRLDEKDTGWWVNKIKEEISASAAEGVFMNSAEISVVKNSVSFLNSRGLDYSWTGYSCFIELVTGAEGGRNGEVEIAALYRFSDYPERLLERTIPGQTADTAARAGAVPMPALRDVPVVLKGSVLRDFFSFFLHRASAESIHEGISRYSEGMAVQKGGDLLTVDVIPYIPCSGSNVYVDQDGIIPSDIRIIENGRVSGIVSDLQFGTYLGKRITGKSENLSVATGSGSREGLYSAPFLEIAVFSDFTMDHITGAFGGEVRLAYYFDGNKTVPVTGGSVTGRIDEVMDSIILSSSVTVEDGYTGPDFIVLKGTGITGA